MLLVTSVFDTAKSTGNETLNQCFITGRCTAKANQFSLQLKHADVADNCYILYMKYTECCFL